MQTLELDGWKAQRVGRGSAPTRKTNPCFLPLLNSCRSWLNNEVSLASAAPTASCSLIFSCFSRGASWHHGFTQLFRAEKHLWQQETLLLQPQPHVRNTVRHRRSPTRHKDLASAPLLRRRFYLQTASFHRESTLWRWRVWFFVLFCVYFSLFESHAQNNHGEFQKSGTNAAEQNWCVALLIDFNLAWSSGREHSWRWRWRWAETSQATKSAVVTLLHKGSAKSGTELGKWWN